jgi:L-ascorbate metabolism protein UlaG (beta-lactamase superfamily)
MIHIQYFGHSFWKVWDDEVSVAIDPYGDLGCPPPQDVSADVVLSSHDHFDHNNVGIIQNSSLIIKTPGEFTFKNSVFNTYGTYHDEEQGAKRGKNLLMKFQIGNRTFLHCGDLGALPGQEIIQQVLHPDVLFIPVGGFYTIDADQALEFVHLLQPRLIFPMHYRTKLVDSKIAPVADYLSKVNDVVQIQSNILDLTEDLFQATKTIIMQF